MQSPTPWNRTPFYGALVPAQPTPECAGGRVVLPCGLRLSTGCAGVGVSWEVLTKVSCCLYPAWSHPA